MLFRPEDYTEERLLAINYSFQAFIFSHHEVPKSVVDTNNTNVLQTTVVPNDPADFGRNSYGQHTMNDIVQMFGHEHVTLLKLHHTASDVQMWELIHYMIMDNIFLKFDQVHMALYVGKYCYKLVHINTPWSIYYGKCPVGKALSFVTFMLVSQNIFVYYLMI